MRRIESDIRTALLAMPAVTALVGAGESARIRTDDPDEADSLDTEMVVVEVDGEDRQPHLGGNSAFVTASVNVICRAPTRKRSRLLADAVLGTNAIGLVNFSGGGLKLTLESVTPSVVYREDGTQRGLFDVNLMFAATWAETY